MAKKKRGSKPVQMKKKENPLKIGTINMNELQMKQRKFDSDIISQGTGVHKAGKGKGSYTRKQKHRKGWDVA